MPLHPTLLPHLNSTADTAHDGPHGPLFANAGEALFWAVEVLRRRRLPRTSGSLANRVALTPAQHTAAALERLNLAAEATQVADLWAGRFRPKAPTEAAERLDLALKIEQAAQALPAPMAQLLRLWAWGDWADEPRLRAAMKHQESLRQKGLRVRLSYRYSTAQLALLAGVSKTTLWRRLHAALGLLEAALAPHGIVAPLEKPSSATAKSTATVNRADFGK